MLKSDNIVLPITLLSVLVMALSACDGNRRHQVLTFFFTGVPPLDADKKRVSKDKQPIETIQEMKKLISEQKLYSHPIYAAGQCEQCHRITIRFAVPGQAGPSAVFRKGGGMPGGLVRPREKLCIKCHENKSAGSGLTKGLRLHPTSAKGACLLCHDPHQSTNTYMLLQKPENICGPCHLEKNIPCGLPADMNSPDTAFPNACLSCHNPHMGINRLLLTKDYTEVKKTMAMPPAVAGPRSVVPPEQRIPVRNHHESQENEATGGRKTGAP